MSKRALVIKFGGSATTTLSGLNPAYLQDFFAGITLDLSKHFEKAVFVIGGGQRARVAIAQFGPEAALDVTREHAQELGTLLCELGLPVCGRIPRDVDELAEVVAQAKFGVAVGGLELGQSTDAVAMSAAQVLNALGYEVAIVVLSNVPAIYTADPRQDVEARQIVASDLETLIQMKILINEPKSFRHGMSVPLDPVAVFRYQGIAQHPLYFSQASDFDGVNQFLTNCEIKSGTLIKRGEQLCLR